MTFLETALTSRRGLRASQNPAASASRLLLTIKSAARSELSSPIWASKTSRILPVRFGPTPWSGMNLAQVTQTERARPSPLSPPHLSILVLPFANLGGDPGQDYFVDGVTESLTTDLSRISGSFVIGRHTAFSYKGKAVDLTQVGRELNVHYVLEGSVQRGGDRLRVNVQLVDAGTGAYLWADRFDKSVADLFAMQDEIVSRLAHSLNAQLIAAEAGR